MPAVTSPFRYPGSKHMLVDYIVGVLRANLLVGVEFFEPYAGGASVSMNLLAGGHVRRAHLVERDPLLYAFWKCVKIDCEALLDRIASAKVTVDTWRRLQSRLAPDALERYSLADLAFAGLFFNRTNFSGILGAKPIGGLSQSSEYAIDCRFNHKRLQDQVSAVAKLSDRFTVSYGDALGYMKRNAERIARTGVAYIDPPYYQQGRKLYRFHYKERNHRRLAEFLDRQQFPWIVSYDDHPTIRAVFAQQQVVPITLNYAVRESRRVTELMISNRRLLEPEYNISRAEARRLGASRPAHARQKRPPRVDRSA